MFLTQNDLIELTDRQMPSKQIEWLKQNGWKFAVSAAGRPKVSREYFSFKMGIGTDEPKDSEIEPDWSSWDIRSK